VELVVNEARRAASLRRAGLRMVEGGMPGAPLPVLTAWLLAACSPYADGRRDSRTSGRPWLDGWLLTHPGFVERANAAWFRLAEKYGLFGPGREFLLAGPACDDGDDAPAWRRVRLLDDWDLVGAGAASGLLGSRAGCPEFVASSLDGRVAVQCTTEEDGVISIVTTEPWQAPTIRTHMARIIERAALPPDRPDVPPRDRAWARAWLAYLRDHPAGTQDAKP